MKYLLLLVFISISAYSFGQFNMTRGETVNTAATKKLIVVLHSDAENNAAILDAEQKSQYAGFDAKYNETVKEVLPKYWTFTQGEIKYMTVAEVDQIPPTERENYMLLESGWERRESKTQGEFQMFTFDLSYLAKGKKVAVFSMSYLPDSAFTKADVIFYVKVLNNHMYISRNFSSYKESNNAEKNIEFVKSKTLLLDDNKTELTNESLKEDYEYKAEVVPASRIQSELEKESEDYIFIKLIWSPGLAMAAYDAFDTKNCNIVGVMGTGGITCSIGQSKYNWERRNKTMAEQNFDPFPIYEYKPNPYYDPKMKVTLYKSKLKIKKSHIGLLDSKMAQKFNFR